MDTLKILVAEDNQSDRFILAKILKNLGHEVIEAEHGQQAVDRYHSHLPDIVLMDVMMPVMDGKDAAKIIRKITVEKFVPILFLTSISDREGLSECLGAGGDDFLIKPYNPVVIQAKIEAFYRVRTMQDKLKRQHDIIAENHQHLVQEQIAAKAVFDNVAHSGNLDTENIRYLLSPLAVFNGDVLLAAKKPSGGMHVLLGDFTGHGLPAAIGAMPLAEIFYGMTAKGFCQRDILREINLKLKCILPVGFFCCSGFIDLCYQTRSLKYWMGGLPDCYVYRTDGSYEVMESSNLPLGVQDNKHLDDKFKELSLEAGDRVLMWSDGIVEARNQYSEMFGTERVRDVFEEADGNTDAFNLIQKRVGEFVGESGADDDMTMIEVVMLASEPIVDDSDDVTMEFGPAGGPKEWNLEYEFKTESLKSYNPMPLLLHIMMEVPGLRNLGGQLYTLMSELYSNALDHGILRLDSTLKKSRDGFAQYYQLKEERTAQLNNEFIKVRMNHEPKGVGGIFTIEMEDSGDGFDFSSYLHKIETSKETPSGRGIMLMKELCDSVEFIGKGNIIRATISWPKITH